MNSRAQQRDETRRRIVEAAIEAFSDQGFSGASTREIAIRAGVNQGLLTYHFKSKELLWRAAADYIFGELRTRLCLPDQVPNDDETTASTAREVTKAFVRFSAERPEFFRFMMEESKHEDGRMRWLVDTHLKPMYEVFAMFNNIPPEFMPHMFYALAGAASTMFAVAPECRRLTGLDPTSETAIEAHAEFVAQLLLPQT